MKVLIFSGAPERMENSTSERISNHLKEKLTGMGIDSTVFKITDAGIPLFDTAHKNTPRSVILMNHLFRDADVHIWLTPLYHGSMTGVMKNALDWLEYSSQLPQPYLTGKIIGLVCWADGVQAMQGINAMDSVAKALRAWTAPLSVPIQRIELFDENGAVCQKYDDRFTALLGLLTQKKS